MAILDPIVEGDSVRFDHAGCQEAGRKFASAYKSAGPFPHICLDDFIPCEILKEISKSFPKDDDGLSFSRSQEMLKTQFHPEKIDNNISRNFIYSLNSEPFISFLSELTGINGIIPDPYFVGGGIHETKRGGCLGIHADFNNHKIMNVRRRLNLLIYLNENWQSDFGGDLELWSKDMKKCEKKISPIIGRCVIFNTDLDSMHGHPDPLNCPEENSRKSIALYYYTSQVDLNDQPDRTTNFRPRAGTGDKLDRAVALRHFMNEWMPPAIRRLIQRRK